MQAQGTRSTTHRVWSFVALVAAVVGVTAGAVSASPASTTSSPPVGRTPLTRPTGGGLPAAPASSGRYSDPVWYPLRWSAWVSCARTNCKHAGEHYHDYWAQDWTGSFDRDPSGNWMERHPVFAAGAGQVHIERVDLRCGGVVPGGERSGTIVSVDHGGGVHSVYKHLDIEVVEGQWVTPLTRLGTMNAWGSKSCEQSYLHFEIHAGGRRGAFQPFNDLKACSKGRTRTWPDDMTPYDPDPFDGRTPKRYETWDDVTPYSTVTPSKRGPLAVPAGDSSCIPSSFATPDTPPAPRVAATTNSLTASFAAAPAGTRESVLSLQLLRPSSGQWADPLITVLAPSATTYTFTGLDIGRTYRVSIAHRNGVGASEWSDATATQIGGAPLAPTVPRSLKVGRTWIAFGWNRSERVGYPILGYDVAIRAMVRGVWQPWEVTVMGNDSYLRWENRRAATPHQIRVRARSQGGPSPWSRTVAISTLAARQLSYR